MSLQGVCAWNAAVCAELTAVLLAWGREGGMGVHGDEHPPDVAPPEEVHVVAYCRSVWAAREAAGTIGGEAQGGVKEGHA